MESAAGQFIHGGVAIGPLRVYRRAEAPASRASGLTPAQEWARFEAACAQAEAQLAGLCEKVRAELGGDSAAILEIQRMMLEDEDYRDAVRSAIDGGEAAAEHAVLSAGELFAGAFAAMDDAYMRSRAADVRDVSRRVAGLLAGRAEDCILSGGPVILASEDLTPSELMRLDKSKLLGVVTRRGSANSHTAILARAMNIPALTGVDFREDWDGRTAVLDGFGRRLCVDPDAGLLAGMEEQRRIWLEEAALLRELKGKPNVTLDGREIEVCANVSGPGDVDLVLQSDAQGVGLFRSEFLFLEAEDFPTEEEQFAAYRRVAEAMAGKRTVIRTLDIGADKQAAYFGLEKEENPALGLRAIRICLTRREIFKTQLRAILRAGAFGNVAVLLPMIISLEEVREVKKLLEECRAELRERGEAAGALEVGAMVETPAAVMIADELARETDFLSLGTNDLTQYALAVDRQDPGLERFWDPRHPAVLRMIRHTVEAGHRHGCRVGICGELGADRELTETFLRMGVDELSVAPSAVLPLRRLIRSLDLRREEEGQAASCGCEYRF